MSWTRTVALVGFASAALSSSATDLPGLFNDRLGLRHWSDQVRAYLDAKRSGTAAPERLDIVTLGHSIEEGIQESPPGDTGNWFAWRYSNLLRIKLRAVLASLSLESDPKPYGGMDFVPAIDSSRTPLIAGPGSFFGGQRTGFWSDHRYNDPDMADGVCRRYTESIVPGSTARFFRAPQTARMFSDTPTSVQFVYQQIPNGGEIEVAVTSYDEKTVYARQRISCQSRDGSIHFGVIGPSLPLTMPGAFWIRVTNVSEARGAVRWEGVRFASGDENEGVHVTNLACGGTIADSYSGVTHAESIANIDPDVILIWEDQNDLLGTKAKGIEFWRSSIDRTLGDIRARMPDVSIVLKIGFDHVGGPWPTWEMLEAYCESLARKYNAAVFSHHVYAGRQPANQFCVPRGISLPYKVHFTRDPGQVFEADLMQRVLLSGL